jgi:hypothetical protein
MTFEQRHFLLFQIVTQITSKTEVRLESWVNCYPKSRLARVSGTIMARLLPKKSTSRGFGHNHGLIVTQNVD